MTDDQIEMAIALGHCTFVPGTNTKRFARSMRDTAKNIPEHELTDKQHKYLCEATIKFRRQIPERVVHIAQKYIDGN